MKIIIDSDINFIKIDWENSHDRFNNTYLHRADIKEVSLSKDSNYVVIALNENIEHEIDYTQVSEVNGNTSISSNAVLISEINKLRIKVISGSSTINRKPVSTTVSTVLAANNLRNKFILFNDGNQNIFVKYGTGATTTDYTYKLSMGGGYEELHYKGIVTAIIASGASINLQVTEM